MIVVAAVFTTAALAGDWGTASAQAISRNPARYERVSKPVISPYFNLFRGDVGGVPSYYMFLERDRRVQATFRREEALSRYHAEELRGLERRLLQRGAPGAEPAPQGLRMRPTAADVRPAVPATFNNRSHYYNSASAAR